VYFAFAAIYAVLVVFFIVDVLRQPSTALSGVAKTLWIAAVILVPIIAWLGYGLWRIQRSRL
jgi:hypothetical protein